VAEAVVALDVGEARIGLARGELGSSFVFGRGYIVRTNPQEDVAAVAEFARSERAELVVVGLPVRTDGADSAQTEKVRQFALQLQGVGLTVEFEDERFTTKVAADRVVQGVPSRRKRQEKGLLDEASAVLILESYLARVGNR